MPRLYMIRHGRAAALGDANLDPGLDAVGLAQAEQMAAEMAPLGPLPILASPLCRTRETAAPLERIWGIPARIEPRVTEIPFPAPTLQERAAWLREIMPARWPAQAHGLQTWRQSLIGMLLALTDDTVIVTHFVALNVAVGIAAGDDRLVCFHPDNCSRTVFDIEAGRLTLVILGEETTTRVF